MKIYTRTGDDGSTGLVGNTRIGKDDLRMEVIGSVDETNAAVGLALAACKLPQVQALLLSLQNQLFELGSDLATVRSNAGTEGAGGAGESAAKKSAAAKNPTIGSKHIEQLEQAIDQAWEQAPPLRYFVLPGGSELSARLHVARTVCRRAERLCVHLGREQNLGPHVLPFLNRLSDLLFAMARQANALQGVADVPWRGKDAL